MTIFFFMDLSLLRILQKFPQFPKILIKNEEVWNMHDFSDFNIWAKVQFIS